MRIAFTELRRTPSRFMPALGALTLLVVLLFLLGGLLDGLYLGSTGALRSQDADLIVYSEDSRDSLIRSRIEPRKTTDVLLTQGVESASGLGTVLAAAHLDRLDEPVDVAVFGYEKQTSVIPAVPAPGTAWADERLKAAGVEVGDTLEIGQGRFPIEVVGFVEDTSYFLQGSMWTDPSTWRRAAAAARPDAVVEEGVFQALLVEAAPGTDPGALAEEIEAQSPRLSAMTIENAILALPGVSQQNSTFNSIIFTTFVVAGLVVALFFALITLERASLFGVLKAMGGSSARLAGGVAAQAILISLGALALGTALSLGLAAVTPPEIPVQFELARAVQITVGLVVTALIGSALSFRRIIRIDPATAVGGA